MSSAATSSVSLRAARSMVRKSSSNAPACAITRPSDEKTAELPSKTSSSLPPTWLTKMSGLRCASASFESICRRRSHLPKTYGDAETFTMNSTSRLTSSATGLVVYLRELQKLSSFHTSSQIVIPIFRSPRSAGEILAAGEKYRTSSKTS